MAITDILNTRDQRLSNLFGAYFHQDWELDAPSVLAQVDRAAGQFGDAEYLRLLASEVRWLATQGTTSQELWDLITETYGSSYTGEFVNEDATEWLHMIADRLEAHADLG